MSLNDATEKEWDSLKAAERYFDNRPFPEPECMLPADHREMMKRDRYAPSPDPVNSPSHYTHGGIECIDAIDAMLGRDGSMYAYEANVLKYLWRWRYKGGVESLRKARWYIDRLINKEVQGG